MRGISGAALGLLVVAGAVFSGRPLDVSAVGGVNTVTVTPGHGKAASSLVVSYAVSPCLGVASLTIGFSWGALPTAGGQVLGSAPTDSSCRATLSTKPPVNATTHQVPGAGSYQVFGYAALPTGVATPGTEANASYTVDVTPAPTTTATATARPTASSQPSASAPAATGASAPATSDQPGTVATPQGTAGNLTLARPGSTPLWWNLEWTVGRRALVVALAILIVLAFLAGWLLRWRRRTAAPALPKDKAA
jgi:hypothetical protein